MSNKKELTSVFQNRKLTVTCGISTASPGQGENLEVFSGASMFHQNSLTHILLQSGTINHYWQTCTEIHKTGTPQLPKPWLQTKLTLVSPAHSKPWLIHRDRKLCSRSCPSWYILTNSYEELPMTKSSPLNLLAPRSQILPLQTPQRSGVCSPLLQQANKPPLKFQLCSWWSLIIRL